MAKEIGKVIKIEDSWMYIKVPTAVGCASCGLKSACTFSGPDSAYRNFKLPYKSGIKEGNQVTLEIQESAQTISALIIFGSPIILFLASYLIIEHYLRIPNSEIWSVLTTIILYGIALIFSNRWLRTLTIFQPKIVDVEKPKNSNNHNDIKSKPILITKMSKSKK
jgi:positive regulator of sigma E activity